MSAPASMHRGMTAELIAFVRDLRTLNSDSVYTAWITAHHQARREKEARHPELALIWQSLASALAARFDELGAPAGAGIAPFESTLRPVTPRLAALPSQRWVRVRASVSTGIRAGRGLLQRLRQLLVRRMEETARTSPQGPALEGTHPATRTSEKEASQAA